MALQVPAAARGRITRPLRICLAGGPLHRQASQADRLAVVADDHARLRAFPKHQILDDAGANETGGSDYQNAHHLVWPSPTAACSSTGAAGPFNGFRRAAHAAK